MNLFLIVYERDESCDWFFTTSELEYLQEDKMVRKLIAKNYDIPLKDFDDYIDDYWTNKISEVDNYKIKLEKE